MPRLRSPNLVACTRMTRAAPSRKDWSCNVVHMAALRYLTPALRTKSLRDNDLTVRMRIGGSDRALFRGHDDDCRKKHCERSSHFNLPDVPAMETKIESLSRVDAF